MVSVYFLHCFLLILALKMYTVLEHDILSV